jgi:hypothetical protein
MGDFIPKWKCKRNLLFGVEDKILSGIHKKEVI